MSIAKLDRFMSHEQRYKARQKALDDRRKLREADAALTSAVVRGEPREEIDRLREAFFALGGRSHDV